MPSLVLIGDVGGSDTYHVGDEAMLAANLTRLRRHFGPELKATVISSDPAATAKRYGVTALPRLDIPLECTVERLETLSSGFDDSASPALAAVRQSDALVISGGGNLNSTWRRHLYERIVLLRTAHRLGKPALVLGQTLGPDLVGQDRRLLASSLARTELLGLRELDSLRLALHLGVPVERVRYQLDDAFYLDAARPPGVELPEGPWIAVTLTGNASNSADTAAESLAELARATAAELLFVPHAGAPDADVLVGEALAGRVGRAIRVLPLLTAAEVRWITERASLVVSSRYHPLVFAVAAGIPALGLYSDSYTRVKLRGALEHGGLQDWCIDRRLLFTTVMRSACMELWQRRDEVRTHLRALRPLWRRIHRRHWTEVMRILEGVSADRRCADAMTGCERRLPGRGTWVNIVRSMANDADRAAWEERMLGEQRDEAERYALSLRSVLRAREEELSNLKSLMANSKTGHPSGPGAPHG